MVRVKNNVGERLKRARLNSFLDSPRKSCVVAVCNRHAPDRSARPLAKFDITEFDSHSQPTTSAVICVLSLPAHAQIPPSGVICRGSGYHSPTRTGIPETSAPGSNS